MACRAEGGACRPHAHAHTVCWSRVTWPRVCSGSRVSAFSCAAGAVSMARQPAAQHTGALHVPEMEILVLIIKFHLKSTFGPLGLCLALFYNS